MFSRVLLGDNGQFWPELTPLPVSSAAWRSTFDSHLVLVDMNGLAPRAWPRRHPLLAVQDDELASSVLGERGGLKQAPCHRRPSRPSPK